MESRHCHIGRTASASGGVAAGIASMTLRSRRRALEAQVDHRPAGAMGL
jgi:hypothetical protein